MRRLTALIIGSLTVGAPAYVPSAPIQWMNQVVMLEGPAGPFRVSAAPQQLLMKNPSNRMSRDSVPYFTLNSDSTIALESTGSCIEAANSNSGSAVRLNRCTGEPLQTWNWIPDRHGGNRIQLKDTGKCLDASVEGGVSGAPIVLWECESKGAEAWKFEETVPAPKRGQHMLMNLITLAGVAALSLGALLRQYMGPRKLVPNPGGATANVDEGGVSLSSPLAVQMTSKPSNASQRCGDVLERTEIHPNDSTDRQPAILHPDTRAEYMAKRKIVAGISSQRTGYASRGAVSNTGGIYVVPNMGSRTEKEGRPVHEALKRMNGALTVSVEVSGDIDESPLTLLSMKLRQLNVVSIWTDSVSAVKVLAEEQKIAKSDFPGPCPVIYMGDSVELACSAGANAVVLNVLQYEMMDQSEVHSDETVQFGECCSLRAGGEDAVDVIWSVSNADEASAIGDAGSGGIFLIAADADVPAVLAALPSDAIAVAAVGAMQPENAEITSGRELKAAGCAAVLVQGACIGDAEDLPYTKFVVGGLTSKASRTFNIGGLTGSTNGHFGVGNFQKAGVKEWKRGG